MALIQSLYHLLYERRDGELDGSFSRARYAIVSPGLYGSELSLVAKNEKNDKSMT